MPLNTRVYHPRLGLGYIGGYQVHGLVWVDFDGAGWTRVIVTDLRRPLFD